MNVDETLNKNVLSETAHFTYINVTEIKNTVEIPQTTIEYKLTAIHHLFSLQITIFFLMAVSKFSTLKKIQLL